LIFVLALGAALAQYGFGRGGRGGRGGGDWYEVPPRDIFPSNTFTFCRIQYSNGYNNATGGFGGFGRRDRGRGRGWGGGASWDTDYPASDLNFSIRLAELTTIDVNRTETGGIEHAVVRLTDPDLFKYPFAYILEVENLGFDPAEQEALRNYLLRGGFLLVDDFWGYWAWENWRFEIGQVLPPEEYPIVDIPLDHEIFHTVFNITEVPQIPNYRRYDYWLATGIAYETNHDYQGDPSPHCRGIFDPNGRLMVVMMHNTDLGDGWEREGVGEGYFRDFCVRRAYPMGINIVVYAMTH
jgi:hypothetical protein